MTSTLLPVGPFLIWKLVGTIHTLFKKSWWIEMVIERSFKIFPICPNDSERMFRLSNDRFSPSFLSWTFLLFRQTHISITHDIMIPHWNELKCFVWEQIFSWWSRCSSARISKRKQLQLQTRTVNGIQRLEGFLPPLLILCNKLSTDSLRALIKVPNPVCSYCSCHILIALFSDKSHFKQQKLMGV